MNERTRVVVGAAILDGDKVLAAQRQAPPSLAGKWELPGGKVELGETSEAALVRECREELGVDVALGARVGRDWPIGEYGVFQVWLATIVDGTPQCRVHSEFRWLTLDELYDVEWLPADLPIVERLAAMLLDIPSGAGTGVRLRGGNAGGAVRVGGTVRRPAGAWTPSVHALLDYLRRAGLEAVPRVLGVDDSGRDVVEYVLGDTADAHDPWPAWAWSDALLARTARWLRRFHDTVAEFAATGPTRWRFGDRPLAPGEVICHRDVAQYNLVVGFESTGAPVLRCVIDWDAAGPGTPLQDLALMAWNFLPGWEFYDDAEVVRRLRILAEAYGISASEILGAIAPARQLAVATIHAGAAAGDPGMINLVDGGHVAWDLAQLDGFVWRLPSLRELLG